MIGDAWESWRRQHRQAAVISTAQRRTYRELLTRGLSAWLTAFWKLGKERMRAKVNCARAMLIRERFEARDEKEAMIHWVNHRRRRVPVPEKYIRYMRLKGPT